VGTSRYILYGNVHNEGAYNTTLSNTPTHDNVPDDPDDLYSGPDTLFGSVIFAYKLPPYFIAISRKQNNIRGCKKSEKFIYIFIICHSISSRIERDEAYIFSLLRSRRF